MAWGERLVGHPLAWVALILLQVVLFALAMPGSLVLWVVAPFMNLVPAVTLLVTGGVLGALAAWWVARWLGNSARSRVESHPVYRMLARGSDPFTQCALRMLPGFPHAVINYAGGALALPLAGFLAAAAVGLAVKWTLYVSAIQALLDVGEGTDALGPGLVAPLLVLVVFLLGGRWLATRVRARSDG